MSKITYSVLILLLTLSQSFAQLTSADIDSLVQDAMKRFSVAGAAVAIVKDGKVVHSKGYGVKSVDTKEKVNEHTNFAIASNSKAFTTAALAILVEDGKLNWTDKVKKYIPEFKMYDDYVTENFNIQDLLTHRSGLGLGAGDLMFFPDGTDFTIEDILTSFQFFEPQSAFRTKFDYDNLLYVVAGEVIKRITGKSWEAYVTEKIIRPLEMNNTYASLSMIKDKSNLATPHVTKNGHPKTIVGFEEMINGAAGGIISNVDDLTSWMLVHLNQGKYGRDLEKKLFSERNQREMWRIHTTLLPRKNSRYNTHFSGYGLGWFLSDYKGNLRVSHTGGLAGMLSRTVMIPDLGLGVVVLTNTESGGSGVFQAVTRTVVDHYLGMDDYHWVDKFYDYYQKKSGEADSVVTAVWKTVDSAPKSYIPLENLVGTFEDNWFGKVDISLKNNQLWFKARRSPKLSGPMAYYKANSFAIKWSYPDMSADAFAMFSLDEEGKAISIKMKGISPEIDFSYDFQDLDLQRVKDD